MPKKTPSDAELVKKALDNLEAFGELINRYEEKLLRYILRISHFSLVEAEEILQEIFIKAWKNLKEFDQSLSFSSWIYRIAHNETISQYRKANSRKDIHKVSLTDLFELETDELPIPEQTDRKLRAEQVRATMEEIPKKYREVLILKYLEDKSYEEISDILKKPMGTIATLVNRAKKQFEKHYKKLFTVS